MNAYELLTPSGQATDVYMCDTCKRVYCGDAGVAERCCACWICGKPLSESELRITAKNYHDACESERRSKAEALRLEKAVVVVDYEGPVFCEGIGYGSFGDGFFADVNELEEAFAARVIIPEFAYCCRDDGFPGINISDILENACSDMYEDAQDNLSGVDELSAAIDIFNNANKGMQSWTPDYTRKVRMPVNSSRTSNDKFGGIGLEF